MLLRPQAVEELGEGVKLKGMDLGGTGGKTQIVIGHKRSRLGMNVGNLVQKSRFVPVL